MRTSFNIHLILSDVSRYLQNKLLTLNYRLAHLAVYTKLLTQTDGPI